MRARTLACTALAALAAGASCATSPRPERAFSGPIGVLEAEPLVRRDLDLVLARVDRAAVRVRAVSPDDLPHVTELWHATGTSVLPVVVSFETDPTQCEAAAGEVCTHADAGATRADGRSASPFTLDLPKDTTDPTAALLWAAGMGTLALPMGAMVLGDPGVLAPPRPTPPPREVLAAYERLDGELRAAGIGEVRALGTRHAYGRVFRRDRESPLAELVVTLRLAFGHPGRDRRRCTLDLVVPVEALPTREVALGRAEVRRVACAEPRER